MICSSVGADPRQDWGMMAGRATKVKCARGHRSIPGRAIWKQVLAKVEVDDMESTINEAQTKEDQWKAALRTLKEAPGKAVGGTQMGNGGGFAHEICKPRHATGKTGFEIIKKLLGMALGGGVSVELRVAFLIEMVLDRSVKRSVGWKENSACPSSSPFRTSPRMGIVGWRKFPPGNRASLKDANRLRWLSRGDRESVEEPASAEMAPWILGTGLHTVFIEGLRDRLIVNLRSKSHS